MSARQVDAVIFDLDGVLVTTDELHYRAWKEMAEGEGIHFDRQINHRLRGVSRLESLEIILERAARAYTSAEKQALAQRKNTRYVALLAALSPEDVLPGARPLLDALRARGVRLAMASSSRNARTILERVGLVGEFEACVDGNDVTRGKPDPELFLTAAQRLGIPPGRCLVVEDALAGVEAARLAGMAAFGIGTPGSLPGVTRLARSLCEVSAEQLVSRGE
jgi:beta-phosphoglucomutase